MMRYCISILMVFLLLIQFIPATTASATPLTNLALNKTATTGTGSFCSGNETAAKAVDGNSSTKWCRNSGADWLQVDLGATYNVSEFILMNAGNEMASYITKAYTIQTSTDGSIWTTVVNVTNNTTNIITNDITPVMARYVRLNVTSPTQSGGGVIRIYEFGVNGDPTALVNAAVPIIESQPKGATVNEGDSSPTLSAAASVSDGGTLSYQWYSNTTNSNSGGTAIGGAMSASYVAPTNAAGTKYYYVVVTNTNNGVDGVRAVTATSNVVAVSVNALVNAAVPIIESQPKGATVNEGDSSPTLSAAASVSDGGTLGYQWYSNTTNSNSGGTAIGGATSASYAAPTNAAGTKYYYVVVTNTNNGINGAKTATTRSNVASVNVNVAAPLAPTNLTAAASDGQLTLQWNGVSKAVNYDIFEGTASGSYGSIPVATVTGLTYNFNVTGLTNGITYYFVIKARNAGGYSGYSNEVSATPLSMNANLNGLILSSGTLNVPFDANMISYSTSVANSVSSLTVTATVYDPTATMKVNGTPVTSGTAVAISLNEGSNIITVVVTAQNGMTTQTYKVTVTRESDLFVTSAQTDVSGHTIQLTFNRPLAPQSIAPDAFLIHAGSKPIGVTQVVQSSSLSNTVYLTTNENLFKWDRLTVDIQGGVIQSVYGSQLAQLAFLKVQNESAVFSPDFSDPDNIRIDNIVTFLNKRNFDVDVNGDGVFDSADIKMLLLQIQSVTH
ncbi:discoidin domain-containing protein [Paenibacillus radicis (ex Xue et al. 2023)]|uniref:Discoidin domain-containing protein n=1 Tax=Paenibacillus radicis (ex Xue et al. 2023) TaxID=2972489 RepID=A0ABT1YAK9_9BACL|nr:discoidin domain-containing protein [Paenibacillus radicis (ex Xue et al. 2023)]MCR8630231.1 discoidin domain-containing protein [Paenibacillus radicis (ex Xue et al. 2023)]